MASLITSVIPFFIKGLFSIGIALKGALVGMLPYLPLMLATSAAILGAQQAWEAITTGDSGIARFLRETFPNLWDGMVNIIGGSIHWIIEKWSKLRTAVSDLIETIIGWFTGLPGRIASAIRGTRVGGWLLGKEENTPITAPTTKVNESVAQTLVPTNDVLKQFGILPEQREEDKRIEEQRAREALGWQKQIAEQLHLLTKTQQEALEYNKLTEEEKKELARRGIRENRFNAPYLPYATAP